MKKTLVYLLSIIVLISCNSQKSVSNEGTEMKLKKNQFIGKFVELNKTKSRNVSAKLDIYFQIEDKDYFVKFEEGYVSKAEVLKFLNQLIKVKGEIKNGEWESSVPGSISSGNIPVSSRKGNYFVVNRIYK